MKTTALSVVLLAALASPAHAITAVVPPGANVPGHSEVPSEKAKPSADHKRLFKAGGLGCITGALGGLLSKDRKAAIAGCAIGGAVGSIASYREQMKEARELAAAAQAAGMPATIQTKQVQAQQQTVEALDQVVIAYDPASMSARDAKTAAVLDRIAVLAKKSRAPLTITAEGRDRNACQVPLAELHSRGTFPPATAVDRCGQGKPQLLISPVPDLT